MSWRACVLSFQEVMSMLLEPHESFEVCFVLFWRRDVYIERLLSLSPPPVQCWLLSAWERPLKGHLLGSLCAGRMRERLPGLAEVCHLCFQLESTRFSRHSAFQCLTCPCLPAQLAPKEAHGEHVLPSSWKTGFLWAWNSIPVRSSYTRHMPERNQACVLCLHVETLWQSLSLCPSHPSSAARRGGALLETVPSCVPGFGEEAHGALGAVRTQRSQEKERCMQDRHERARATWHLCSVWKRLPSLCTRPPCVSSSPCKNTGPVGLGPTLTASL